MPAAEVDVSPDLVASLVADQHPDLRHLPVTLLANGWDNVICRLGDDLLVRLPRRAMAADLVRHEQRWLPLLAPRLPLAIPVPVRTGSPATGNPATGNPATGNPATGSPRESYPWSWSIVPFLPGQIAAVTPPADPGQAAASLGSFLNALHTPASPDAPVNQFRGIPLAERQDNFRQNVAVLAGRIEVGTVTALWETALAAAPWPGSKLWLHGDLHPANILVHEGQLQAVIDFGDITSGDPATDLAIAWMLFPDPRHRERFWAAYQKADDHTRARAKGWALAFSLVYQAHSADNPMMAGIGRRTYRTVLADR